MTGTCTLKYPCPYIGAAQACCICPYYIPDLGDIEDMEESVYD